MAKKLKKVTYLSNLEVMTPTVNLHIVYLEWEKKVIEIDYFIEEEFIRFAYYWVIEWKAYKPIVVIHLQDMFKSMKDRMKTLLVSIQC